MSILSERLKKLRESKGLNNRQVCYAIFGKNLKDNNDIDNKRHEKEALYSQYEKDISTPKYDTLIKFAKFYHVTTDYLLGISDYENEANISIEDITGLSKEAVEMFKTLKNKGFMDSFNALVDIRTLPIFFVSLIRHLAKLIRLSEANDVIGADIEVELSEYQVNKNCLKILDDLRKLIVPAELTLVLEASKAAQQDRLLEEIKKKRTE